MKVPPKVMIVEDEAIIAKDIGMQLSHLGFAVAGTARTAAEAFRQIEKGTPDLILMDIRLKGEMDGVEAAEVIRNRYALPVIYLTAHADDATLERAQQTEPFGYIVKPVGNSNMKAAIKMALHKHRMERELDNHRRLLFTILQGLPEAVIVTDPTGEILLINLAAEQLTGWSFTEAAGKSVFEVAPIENSAGRIVLPELFEQVTVQATPIRIARNSALIARNGAAVAIAGQLTTAPPEKRPAGVFITLQDVTVQKREGQRLQQEQQMFVAGELAFGAAKEFYSLFDLIDESSVELAVFGQKPDLDLMLEAAKIGKGMSVQLMDLREAHGAAHAINVTESLLGSQPLLERLCGDRIKVEVSTAPALGYVLSTGNHFEQMLIHLVLDAAQRIHGRGVIRMVADVSEQKILSPRAAFYVRLAVRADKPAQVAGGENERAPLPFGLESHELGLTIVRTIAIASGGFTHLSESSDVHFLIEVFLPRHESRFDATAAVNEYAQTILLVGLELKFAEAVRRVAGESVLLLEAASVRDAVLISELFAGDLDLVILSDRNALLQRKERACERIRERRPQVAFLEIGPPADGREADPMNMGEFERRVEELLRQKRRAAVASA